MKYYIKTFGCQQNKADSERIERTLISQNMTKAKNIYQADYVIINTCMVRQSAEDRVYGLVRNLTKLKQQNKNLKIIVTGCMVGLAFRDKSGKFFKKIRDRLPEVDEFMPIEEIGFDNKPIRQDKINAWVPISNGCNNFCTFCIVPFTRGREISRSYEDIINECFELKEKGYQNITLLGQNVNSYGADLILGEKNIQIFRDLKKNYFQKEKIIKKFNIKNINKKIKPVYVKHLGRYRIPTLFPYLLEDVAKIGFKKVDFISSNPWDFSDQLIEVIANNKNITRTIHLPVQSGDNRVLKRMNRWYTRDEYLELINKLKSKIKNLKLTTDIIVGFCGETDQEFENTVDLCKKVNFEKAYIAMYSPRPFTLAINKMKDDIPYHVKKTRWQTLENLINKKIKN